MLAGVTGMSVSEFGEAGGVKSLSGWLVAVPVIFGSGVMPGELSSATLCGIVVRSAGGVSLASEGSDGFLSGSIMLVLKLLLYIMLYVARGCQGFYNSFPHYFKLSGGHELSL